MSFKSTLSSSCLAYQARSSSLLPFLYCTQTLLTQTSLRRLCKISCNQRKNRRTISSTTHDRVETFKKFSAETNVFNDHVFANPRSIPTPDPALPFDDANPDIKAQDTKPSTITASEKAVFERIRIDAQQASIDEDEEPEGLEDEQDMETDPYEDLNAIFDEAISKLRGSEIQRGARAVNEEQLPAQPNQEAGEQLVGKDTPFAESKDIQRSMKMKRELRKGCEDHQDLVSGMLEQATTDVDIWGILEKHVFGLLEQYDFQVSWEEKARKARQRDERKIAKGRSTGEETASGGRNLQQGSTAKKHSKVIPGPTEIQTNTLFAILQSNYADYILSALRLLRRHHPSSSYVFCILPRMKELGQMSYVLGATIDLYNEILFLKWTQSSDLRGMADLMQEMLDQGIGMNEVTEVFIQRVGLRKHWAWHGSYGSIVQKWWETSGHAEDWKRICFIYRHVRKENRERREREALLMGEDYEGEEKGKMIEHL